MAAAIFYRFTGYAINVALLLEAEFLFILGLRLQLKYLRMLGGAVFALAAGKVLIYDYKTTRRRRSPVTCFTQGLRPRSSPRRPLTQIESDSKAGVHLRGRRRSSCGSCSRKNFPTHTSGLRWIILGGCLFEYGIFARDFDLRTQGYSASVSGVGALR